jgi:hypothetical protein
MIASSLRLIIAAAMVTALAFAPVAQARDWRGHGGYRGDYRHHNNAGAAIIGGLIGLGVGAAIASGGYAVPPPAYYYSPPGYYAPPPPAVYYGY